MDYQTIFQVIYSQILPHAVSKDEAEKIAKLMTEKTLAK
jgi:hypothetical protein